MRVGQGVQEKEGQKGGLPTERDPCGKQLAQKSLLPSEQQWCFPRQER